LKSIEDLLPAVADDRGSTRRLIGHEQTAKLVFPEDGFKDFLLN
jgi:hypothetical protein